MLTAITFHLLFSTIWVGGMFFAYLILRPSIAEMEPAKRISLWLQIFKRFFPIVWISIIFIIISGYWMIFNVYGGFASLRIHIHIMQALGLLMTFLFGVLYFYHYNRMQTAFLIGDIPKSAQHLNSIRKIVATNLLIGTLTMIIGVSGKYW